MAATFHEHMTLGQQHPAYWSYLTTLELIDAPVAAMDAPGRQWRRTGPSHGHVAGLGLARARRRVTTQIVPVDTTAAARAESGGSRIRKTA